MKTSMVCAVLVAFLSGIAQAELPKTLEDFQKLIEEKAADPKGAVKLWFDAVIVFLKVNKDLGQKMILEMDRYKEWDSRTFRLFRDQITRQPYIIYSYAKGATPDNKYEFDINNYELMFHGEPNMKPYADKDEGAYCKLFVKSNGADNPRPITLQKNSKGQWKFYEFSSIFVGVRPPKEAKIFGDSVPESTDPVWVVHEWLHGILLYLSAEKETGLKLMNSLMKEPTDEKFRDFHDTMNAGKSYIWRSYVKGTSPDNKYEVPDVNNFEIETYYQEGEAPTPESVKIRMFIRSSGADTARPIKLERDDRGEWRIEEFSSLCVGVRKPVDPKDMEF